VGAAEGCACAVCCRSTGGCRAPASFGVSGTLQCRLWRACSRAWISSTWFPNALSCLQSVRISTRISGRARSPDQTGRRVCGLLRQGRRWQAARSLQEGGRRGQGMWVRPLPAGLPAASLSAGG
jgi:hypothetical protein